MAVVLGGCSLRRVAVNVAGNALASGGAGWASDEDPELVREALPFALKTMESLLAQSPRHRGLLLGACSGFTQYAYAFVQSEADYLEAADLAAATAMRARAQKLFLRARDYGLRGLEVDHPGLRQGLQRDQAAVEAVREPQAVALLYWTGVAWGAAISLQKDNADLVADLPVTAALVRRALALDERFGGGAGYDFFIAYEGGRPAAAGGSVERARMAFERAVELSGGRRAAPYVGFAETVCVATQDRPEFERLLNLALAIDVRTPGPDRLANLLAQRRARWLLGRIDELFI
ncbi:MAG: TRAP transporter TatT component family protein [Thermoanaerobaculaceae bacterium]|nr:TRAP transporter TatT component family protein [Thermoanaerobaculaceae bacterium]MDI9622363.1 TRAP transporter TatT component family protein [Acidobacteriota bacterium]HPW56587.1 TRAP transporter TatT component family protein [Thermoanaerobaculaceae bacterium]